MASRFFAPATLRSAAARAPSAVARRQAPTAVPRRFASGSAHKDPLLAEQEHATEHAAKSADLWRKISMYFCLPGALVMSVYIYQIETAHLQHQAHELAMNGGELPEEGRPNYEYSMMRKKPFPWGDGNKSFFHNDKVNYLPEAQ